MSPAGKTADAVVIGGGIMGCATAYYLKRAGFKEVTLLERGKLCDGSTGRCAGGFRQQFPTESECRVAKESADMIKTLTDELEYDFEYNPGGYLVLAYTDSQVADAKQKIEMQNSLGIDVRWLNATEVSAMAPWLNQDTGFVGAAFCPSDGIVNPFKFTYGYAQAAKKLGCSFQLGTNVTGIGVKNGVVTEVNTDKGVISTNLVFNCTGAFAASIGSMIGVDIPVTAKAREKMITEPVERFQPFLCHSPLHNLHFNQTQHGSILMSRANLEIPQRDDLKSTWRFMEETATSICKLVPMLANTRMVRQWAGFYEVTPDGKPIIGGVRGIEGFHMTAGFNGHGLMLAPAVAQALVNAASGRPAPQWLGDYSLDRFTINH